MTQYIDKSALVAEIEKLKERAKAERVLHPKTILAAKNYLLIEDYKKLLSFLDTLEVKEVQEEHVSIDFEHELYKAFGQVKDFTLGMRIAKWFYDMGKNSQEPVSEDLEKEMDSYIKANFTIDKEQLDWWGIKENDYMYSMDKSDMKKMVRYFTGNYKIPVSDDLEEAAKLCVSDSLCITNEDDWDDAAIEALNMYKAGAKWQKQQMIKDAVDAECDVVLLEEGDELQYSVLYPKGKKPFNKGDKVKLIIVKED